jgi:hypothetical protein
MKAAGLARWLIIWEIYNDPTALGYLGNYFDLSNTGKVGLWEVAHEGSWPVICLAGHQRNDAVHVRKTCFWGNFADFFLPD